MPASILLGSLWRAAYTTSLLDVEMCTAVSSRHEGWNAVKNLVMSSKSDLVSSVNAIARMRNCFHLDGSENTGGRSEPGVSPRIECLPNHVPSCTVHIRLRMVDRPELSRAVATVASTPPWI